MINIYELNKISKPALDRIKNRSQNDIDKVKSKVEEIITSIRTKGDSALVQFTKEWDDPEFSFPRLTVTKADIREAYNNTGKEIIEKVKEQISLARTFHETQRQQIRDWEKETERGIIVGEKWTAVDKVGLYVPGGKNPFPTVQQILAVAAKTAGCNRIISCISPKGKNYEVLIAANECGIEEIYRVSGAQAIAAMAYGTETISAVDLIAGPGNPYVTAAKILCQAKVAIDMPAGPSEIVILADASTSSGFDLNTKAKYCAADLLAQVEHGPDSAGIVLTDSKDLAQLIKSEIEKQFQRLSRQNYVKAAISTYSAILIAPSLTESIDFINDYAPEHLEILTENPKTILKLINNAGSVFLGHYNPVAVGDYATGINHCLPTCGWARRSSPVGTWTFMKRVQYSHINQSGLNRLQPIVKTISQVEGLDAHQRSVDLRFEKEKVHVS